MTVNTIKITEIIFNQDFYPRDESQSPEKVNEYALSIADGKFPPILIDQNNNLLDGWHRWKAAGKAGLEELEAETLDTSELIYDGKPDMFAIKRKSARSNCRAGIPQTEKEVNKLIRDEYRAKMDGLDQKGRSLLKKDMAEDYSRSKSYVRDATSRIDKDLKAELRETAFRMWMGSYSSQEIADAVGYSRPAIVEFTNLLRNVTNATGGVSDVSSENDQLAEGHENREFDEEAEDTNSLGVYQLDKRLLIKAGHMDEYFNPPIYNIWKKQERTSQVTHFGNSEITWLDNLLYLYTQPFDVVVDPFAGGGSTIDLCKMRLRRYLVSDRKPIDTRDDIRLHDIKDGVLSPPTWKNVKLVYLDPPYWRQAENQYSEDAEDLANMTLDDFNAMLTELIKAYAEKLRRAQSKDAVIALIIQPTQWKADDKKTVDHVADLIRSVKLPILERYSVPYESQQYNAQCVEWAKKEKRCLVLTREIIVWGI